MKNIFELQRNNYNSYYSSFKYLILSKYKIMSKKKIAFAIKTEYCVHF